MMSAGYSLRSRVPGQSVMSEVVASQKLAVPRSRLSRVLGLTPLLERNRALYRAAVGELLVGEALDHLGPDWDVLHAVPVDDEHYEIDHLAIGPPGVFSVLTKNFPGQEVVVTTDGMTVGGKAQDHIDIARTEAIVVADLLSVAARRPVEAQALVVIVNPKKLTVRAQPELAHVVSSKQLLRWIAKLPRVLDGANVAYISDIADRETTWRTPPSLDQDTSELHEEFAKLRAEISSAGRVRFVWASVAFVIIAATVWTTVALVVSDLVAR